MEEQGRRFALRAVREALIKTEREEPFPLAR
jgi:hypothetical protein